MNELKNVVHISAECFPIAKIGGLADVVGALPKYQNEVELTSQVVMPFYDLKFTQAHSFKIVHSGAIQFGSKKLKFEVKTPAKNELGFELYLVHVPRFTDKPYVYSEDDADRFMAFQVATLDWLISRGQLPDIIHCHDHHTGLVPFMMSHCERYEDLKHTPSILTIHNAQYQGWMPHEKSELLPEFDESVRGLLDWDGSINPLAAAIKCAWRVTTVSETYMIELQQKANGLESLIKDEAQKCQGVLNGIDTEVWNPETDQQLIKNYSKKAFQAGKKANKKWLCQKFNLDEKLPLIVFIGRLVGEKGADLFYESVETELHRSKVSLLFLGSGNDQVEQQLKDLAEKYKGQFSTFIGYDESLAHKMYGGADFLLMPSRVEPCGLNQMYSMRYGTVPIVSQVGGLKDTVKDISEKDGYGICISEVSVNQIADGISKAAIFYQKKEEFKRSRHVIMRKDFSWTNSAKKYLDLYQTLKNLIS